MATLKPVVLLAKRRADGKYAIRIALYHHHQTSYIVTRYCVDSPSEFFDGRVVRRGDASFLNMKISILVDEYQRRMDGIRNIGLYTCAQLKHVLDTDRYDITELQTVGGACRAYCAELEEQGRGSYATLIRQAVAVFSEFSRGDLPLDSLSGVMVQNYEAWLRRRKKRDGRGRKTARCISSTMVGMYLQKLKVVVNYARECRMVDYEVSPFVSVKIPCSAVRECDLSLDDMQRIWRSEPKEHVLAVARDVFLLSFMLGGLNIVDLLSLDFSGGTIEYVRTKSRNMTTTVNRVVLDIPADARPIIKRWRSRSGRLDFGYRYKEYGNFGRMVNKALKRLAVSLGIDGDITPTSARKTFSQFASDLGIPDRIVDYCLGHSSKRRGTIRHYSQVRRLQGSNAVAKVIDYVKNPEKYDDYISLRKDIMMMSL